MLRKILLGFLVLVLAAFALPPLWYALFPVTVPELPPPGHAVEVAPGIAVNVLEEGRGSPVVLVHGHPGTGYDWVPFQQTLAAMGHRVIAYDRVGYGRSDGRPDGDYSLERNADELLALLESEDLYDVTLVGWSYGGGTAMVAARKDPSRISRLVLVGSIGPGIARERGTVPPAIVDWVFKPLLAWAFQVPPLSDRFGDTVSAAAFAPEPIAEGYRERSQANFAMPHTFESFRSESGDLADPALLDPATVERPILVVHGDGDQFVSLEIGERLHERAANSELWVVPDGGHMLPLTRPLPLARKVHEFATAS